MANGSEFDLTPYPQIGEPPETVRDEPVASGSAPPDTGESLERETESARSVMVEFAAGPGATPASATSAARALRDLGFAFDEETEVVPMAGGSFVVRGTVSSERAVARLRGRPEVIEVWGDTPIAPF